MLNLMYKLRHLLIFILVFVGTMFFAINYVNAACNPGECDTIDHPDLNYMDPTYQCGAKCCIPSASGGANTSWWGRMPNITANNYKNHLRIS